MSGYKKLIRVYSKAGPYQHVWCGTNLAQSERDIDEDGAPACNWGIKPNTLLHMNLT